MTLEIFRDSNLYQTLKNQHLENFPSGNNKRQLNNDASNPS